MKFSGDSTLIDPAMKIEGIESPAIPFTYEGSESNIAIEFKIPNQYLEVLIDYFNDDLILQIRRDTDGQKVESYKIARKLSDQFPRSQTPFISVPPSTDEES